MPSPLVKSTYTGPVSVASFIFTHMRNCRGLAIFAVPVYVICMKLKTYIESHGLSPARFAAMIGVSQPAVHRYVHNGRIPQRAVMLRISEVTGGKVTPNDFYEREQKKSRRNAA